MKQELVDKFNQYIRDSNKVELMKELKRLRKRKLTLMERISLSDFYDRVSEYYEAFVVLGSKNLSFDANGLTTQDDLLLRAACAQKLANYGAKYTALNILKAIISRAESIEINPQIKKRILFYQANIYYTYNFYEKARILFEDLLQRNEGKEQFKTLFLLAGCYSACGEGKKAEDSFQKIIHDCPSVILQALSHLDLGTHYLKQRELKLARQNLEQALRMIDNEDGGVDRAYLYKWWGYLLFLEKRDEEGRSYLRKSLELIFKFGHFPHAIYEVLYFAHLVGLELNSHQMTTLYTFHEYNHYHQVLQNTLEEKEKKVAVFENGKMTIIDYDSINRSEEYLDLVGGYYSTQNTKEFLSLINWRCLYALCTSNSQGISKFALTDFVYLDKFIDINRTVIKLHKLLKPLEAHFAEIVLQESIYFVRFKENCQYIIPLGREGISLDRFVTSYGLTFTDKPSILKKFSISAKVLKKLGERHFI